MPSPAAFRRHGRSAIGLGCAVAVVALAGCGPATDSKGAGPDSSSAGASGSAAAAKKPAPFAGDSGPDIVNKSLKVTRAATSLTMQADIQDPTEGHVLFTMAVSAKGDCAGHVSLNDEGKVVLSKVGKTVYMKFDEKFVRAQGKNDSKAETDATVDMLAERWVKTSATSDEGKEFATFCDLDTLLGDFEGDDTVARKGPLASVDGRPAITLTESDGKSQYKVYVATEGKPYLLKLVTTGDEPGTAVLSGFDEPVGAKVPTDKDILDLDKL